MGLIAILKKVLNIQRCYKNYPPNWIEYEKESIKADIIKLQKQTTVPSIQELPEINAQVNLYNLKSDGFDLHAHSKFKRTICESFDLSYLDMLHKLIYFYENRKLTN